VNNIMRRLTEALGNNGPVTQVSTSDLCALIQAYERAVPDVSGAMMKFDNQRSAALALFRRE
jgi:hypothetical protein